MNAPPPPPAAAAVAASADDDSGSVLSEVAPGYALGTTPRGIRRGASHSITRDITCHSEDARVATWNLHRYGEASSRARTELVADVLVNLGAQCVVLQGFSCDETFGALRRLLAAMNRFETARYAARGVALVAATGRRDGVVWIGATDRHEHAVVWRLYPAGFECLGVYSGYNGADLVSLTALTGTETADAAKLRGTPTRASSYALQRLGYDSHEEIIAQRERGARDGFAYTELNSRIPYRTHAHIRPFPAPPVWALLRLTEDNTRAPPPRAEARTSHVLAVGVRLPHGARADVAAAWTNLSLLRPPFRFGGRTLVLGDLRVAADRDAFERLALRRTAARDHVCGFEAWTAALPLDTPTNMFPLAAAARHYDNALYLAPEWAGAAHVPLVHVSSLPFAALAALASPASLGELVSTHRPVCVDVPYF